MPTFTFAKVYGKILQHIGHAYIYIEECKEKHATLLIPWSDHLMQVMMKHCLVYALAELVDGWKLEADVELLSLLFQFVVFVKCN